MRLTCRKQLFYGSTGILVAVTDEFRVCKSVPVLVLALSETVLVLSETVLVLESG